MCHVPVSLHYKLQCKLPQGTFSFFLSFLPVHTDIRNHKEVNVFASSNTSTFALKLLKLYCLPYGLSQAAFSR